MSLENSTTGEPSRRPDGEGRREGTPQPSKFPQRSGGVSVDSTSGKSGTSQGGKPSVGGTEWFQAKAQVGRPHKAAVSDGGIRVPGEGVDLHHFKGCQTPSGGTCLNAQRRSEGDGDGRPSRIVTPDKVRKLQIAFYRKAKVQPQWRFWSLYGEVMRWEVLDRALRAITANGGVAGVEGESLDTINATPQTREHWLRHLQSELQAKTYRPKAVMRVWLEKPDGGQRPLGIPCVRDRVVQRAVYLVLMPIFEADFHPHSYGFRPKRSAHQALGAINRAVWSGRVEILDADLPKYFDTIPHRNLMRLVAKRVSDGSVLRLIKSWLRAPVVEVDKAGRGRVIPNRCGTPQGGVLSPLLANLYLNRLDHGVNERCGGQPVLVRYADDFVIGCRPGQEAELKERLRRWLDACGLKLNEQKTRLVKVRQEGIKFLGFSLRHRTSRRGKRYFHIEPHPKSRQALRDRLGQILNHWTLWRPVADVVRETNQVLRGWAGYFHWGHSSAVCNQRLTYSRNRLRRWLWRKHDCRRALWTAYSNQRLHQKYGLWQLPLTCRWSE
jgi:RNA-directed DNA polymerase